MHIMVKGVLLWWVSQGWLIKWARRFILHLERNACWIFMWDINCALLSISLVDAPTRSFRRTASFRKVFFAISGTVVLLAKLSNSRGNSHEEISAEFLRQRSQRVTQRNRLWALLWITHAKQLPWKPNILGPNEAVENSVLWNRGGNAAIDKFHKEFVEVPPEVEKLYRILTDCNTKPQEKG